MSMNDDENAVALSYYILFCSNLHLLDTRSTSTTNIHNETLLIKFMSQNKGNKNETPYPNDSTSTSGNDIQQYWVEDVWTKQDEIEIERLLNDSIDTTHNDINIRPLNSKERKRLSMNDHEAWDLFYTNNRNNFFKDRHYFVKEFPNEFTNCNKNVDGDYSINNDDLHALQIQPQQRCLVEIGCGVGNAMLPLLEDTNINHNDSRNSNSNNIEWTVYGFDLSRIAIDILRQDQRYINAHTKQRAYCDVCDISIPNIVPSYVYNVAHVTTLLFCLSAIHPTKHNIVLQNIISTLQPGIGILVLRDYGRYDLAQIKLGTSKTSKLVPNTNNFYRKHDGTKCYYFTIEDIEQLIYNECNNELEILELKYIRRKYINRSLQQQQEQFSDAANGTTNHGIRRRVWIQGRFRRIKK